MNGGVAVLLAYYFPPLAGIASDRAATLAAQLQPLGWEPVVITPRAGFYHRSGGEWAGSFEVIRTPSPEISRALRWGYRTLAGAPASDDSTVEPIAGGRAASRLRRLLREYVYVPDAQLGWIPFAAGAAARALRGARGIPVLWSTSVPYSAHLAAMAVAERARVAWIAEFRDPWTTADPLNLPRSRLRRAVNRRIERSIVGAADHLVVSSESLRACLLAQYPTLLPSSVSVVTNGFVPIPLGSPPPSDQPMSILYAGTVAPGEDTAPVLAALDRMHARHPGSFRLLVLGPPRPWLARSDAERPWLELRGVVSPDEARWQMRKSSVLLLLQRNRAYRMVLPGKAFEYIGSRRPILAFGHADWELTSLLRHHADLRLVTSVDPGDAVAALEKLLEEHAGGTLQEPRVSERTIAPLRRSEQAKALAAIFDRVASGRA